MMGVLWTGISGLDSHQSAIDNESNNIANVNTIGFKSDRISFADQMYQDNIGKGSVVQDVEKIYEQGNIKLTGVSYDVAIHGDGFFVVTDQNAGGGSSETYYTRAGNFRIGTNGTLQDANKNEVQGWAMQPIDPDSDITSSNPNIYYFTDDYNRLASTSIIDHGSYIETITAKMTDYTETAKSDSERVYTGAGYKTYSAKVADVEELIKAYSEALEAYKKEPDGASASSTTQVSYVDFDDIGGALKGDGDKVELYINGELISQEWTVDYETTMKNLSDKISSIPGMISYTVEPDPGTLVGGVIGPDTEFLENTADSTYIPGPPAAGEKHVGHGILKIESLVPGEHFTVTGPVVVSGTTETAGAVLVDNGREAVKGAGKGHLESIKAALEDAVAGKQQNVYTADDLFLVDTSVTPPTMVAGYDFSFNMTIWDDDLKQNITIPSNPLNFPGLSTETDPAEALKIIEAAINNNGELNQHVFADIINGELVIEPLDYNSSSDFKITLQRTAVPGVAGTTPGDPYFDAGIVQNGLVEKNENLSGYAGAGAEFLELTTTVNQTISIDSLLIDLKALGISDSSFGEFAVDSTGLITMTQDGVSFAVGQLALAMFTNEQGLNPVGNNLFEKTLESGNPEYEINNKDAGELKGKSLELSDSDLSESLVNLMVFQRAYEANAKSITTADEMLTTLLQLKK